MAFTYVIGLNKNSPGKAGSSSELLYLTFRQFLLSNKLKLETFQYELLYTHFIISFLLTFHLAWMINI